MIYRQDKEGLDWTVLVSSGSRSKLHEVLGEGIALVKERCSLPSLWEELGTGMHS